MTTMGTTNIILLSLILIFIIYIAVKYFVKPFKLVKSDDNKKIIYSDAFSCVYGLAFISLIIGIDFWLAIRYDRILSNVSFFFICSLLIKPSCLIISEKKIYIQRQIINAEEIIEIKRNYHSVLKTCVIKIKDEKEVIIRTSKKVLKSIKQFCEINEIEYQE